METARALRRASAGVWYEARCWLSEVLVTWALKVSPPGYVISFVELLAKEMAKNDPRNRIKLEDRT
jgi:hypothetical protein